MNRVMIMARPGPPDVLQPAETDDVSPGPGDLRIRQSAIGVNYADVRQRSGAAPVPLPAVLGVDGAGVVEEIGAGVTAFSVGDRIAYTMLPGAYAQWRTIPADRAIRLPPFVDTQMAAGIVSKGLTAGYLIHDVYSVQPGEVILVHSAAGGVGSLLSQWAAALGATVIGTVSIPEKVAFAQASGCAHVIVRTRENFVDRVRQISGGAGLPVVFDSVGKDTFMGSLDCLRPRGLMVSFGASSGAVEPFDLCHLGRRGALVVTQPGLMAFIGTRDQLAAGAERLWRAVKEGRVVPQMLRRYPLVEAAAAHHALEAGLTTGATILIP